jgi:BirA family biotin operon repressor/biotin-[acetyl-CoA-carboxylase] ligase
VALAEVLQENYSLPARVKWPNDVMVGGKKIAGILLEASGDPHSLSFLNLGMGINVNNDPRQINPGATSVAVLLGETVSRRDLFSHLYRRFRRLTLEPDDSILSAWKAKSSTLGRRVRIIHRSNPIYGTAVDIQRDGALLVKPDHQPTGEDLRSGNNLQPVYAGDIEERD